MPRFDVYELSVKGNPYVVDVQADALDFLETRMIIPLVPIKIHPKGLFSRLTPIIKIDKKKYVLMTPNMGPQETSRLKKKIGNLSDYHHDIVDSIDFLLQGF